MKKSLFLLSLITTGLIMMSAFTTSQKASNPESTASFHSFTINGLLGDEIDMSDFEGKYILCVNVASKCGYTKQYKPLQSLYEQHKHKLVIIGFPCNQFLGQEPGDAEQIATFCERNYGVTFPMTEKINVKGKKQHPIYAWLTDKAQNGVADAKVGWNFNKFLISPKGEWMEHFGSGVDPLSDEIVAKLK
jgi:glutathione peroxidase